MLQRPMMLKRGRAIILLLELIETQYTIPFAIYNIFQYIHFIYL